MNSAPICQSPLSEEDVRGIVRVLGTVIAAIGDIDVKRKVLMEGLCGLVNAESWVWCVARPEPDRPPSFVGVVHGGFDDARLASFVEAMNRPALEAITRNSLSEAGTTEPRLARTTRQTDPGSPLERSPAAPYWIRADIGTLMVSQRTMPDGGISAIGVYRRVGAPQFDERETRLAHILLSEVPWLHFLVFPDPKSQDFARLYPRHRTILRLLRKGWSRKKIASHLNVSINTVHGYAKAIFQHFGVHSQAELVSRFPKGCGEEL